MGAVSLAFLDAAPASPLLSLSALGAPCWSLCTVVSTLLKLTATARRKALQCLPLPAHPHLGPANLCALPPSLPLFQPYACCSLCVDALRQISAWLAHQSFLQVTAQCDLHKETSPDHPVGCRSEHWVLEAALVASESGPHGDVLLMPSLVFLCAVDVRSTSEQDWGELELHFRATTLADCLEETRGDLPWNYMSPSLPSQVPRSCGIPN